MNILKILPAFGLLILLSTFQVYSVTTPGFGKSLYHLINVDRSNIRITAFTAPPYDTTFKKQVPVLCYHYIKKNIPTGSLYVIPEAAFEQQMKLLLDSGYETILPDQVYLSVTKGATLPAKPIVLSFDDGYEEDYLNVFPVLNKLGFKAVFFINTVVVGRAGYMTSEQIKELSDSGHSIGGHTWDHSNIKKLRDRDLTWQIDKPKQDIEKITGKPVEHFAYPHGAWNDAGISKLKKHGIKTAFQFSGKQNEKQPLHTIRRLVVSGNWSETEFFRQIDSTFFLH